MLSGGCQCGAVRYAISAAPVRHSLCHCIDCRKSAGAPAVSWAVFPADAVAVTGEPVWYESSGHARRGFCGRCGTGLFYASEVIFPGEVDLQSATLDDPGALPLDHQVQTAERIGWMAHLDEVPAFTRYPEG